MPDKTSKRLDRLQIMLTQEELEALDNWRFQVRMPSRSAAVRELLRRGLAAEGYYSQAKSGSASSDFGVLDSRRGPED
ncbi:hypothetical protein [Marinibacterium profundimaris]|uniref:Ribbon-helix-helix protein CopG domain-containing protein n=1 Tax=Marinibacterium profundimaris TaxID=1679460 RepID=A0A225ND57_9RHOB|nr:hypothetical protein [Marinibacterium profundimaris]OWU69879.1 hypothetical protein ATO3_21675 [Marinibacterium profundimaris]